MGALGAGALHDPTGTGTEVLGEQPASWLCSLPPSLGSWITIPLLFLEECRSWVRPKQTLSFRPITSRGIDRGCMPL